MVETATNKISQLIVFKIGNEEYGLRIDSVKEVVLTPIITKVPLTPPYIVGVANVRGEILPIIDLAKRLQLPISNQEAKYTLVIEHDKMKLGILSMEVPNTLSVQENMIDTQLTVFQNLETDKRLIEGLVKLGNRLIILVNISQIVLKEDFKQEIEASRH